MCGLRLSITSTSTPINSLSLRHVLFALFAIREHLLSYTVNRARLITSVFICDRELRTAAVLLPQAVLSALLLQVSFSQLSSTSDYTTTVRCEGDAHNEMIIYEDGVERHDRYC